MSLNETNETSKTGSLRRWSIRTRLTLWYVSLLALTLIVFSVGLYVALTNQMYSSLDERLQLATRNALEASRGEGGPPPPTAPSSSVSSRVINSTGQVMNATGILSTAPIDSAALDQARQTHGAFRTIELADGTRARVFIMPLERNGQVDLYVEVAETLVTIEATQRQLALILLVAVPLTLALTAFGGWFLADRALRPIDTITRQAQRISEQDLHRRLNLDLPDDEVGRLARTFDAMLARLDAAFQRQRQFTADASHELRTPLTVMKTNLGVTLNRPRSAKQYEAALMQIDGEVDRLTRLTNDLLLLARADAAHSIAQPRDVDLVPIAHGVIDELQPLAEAKSLALNFSAPPAATVRGDADQLHRLLFNLIENSIKYTAHGGVSLCLAVDSTPAHVRLEIEDTGPGIAAEHLPHLFERFYRVDAARAREQGGSGLGLAIAHSIVSAHGGTIDVNSTVGHGTTFTITLPAL